MDPNYMPQYEREDYEADLHRKHEREINRPRFTEAPPVHKIEHDVPSGQTGIVRSLLRKIFRRSR